MRNRTTPFALLVLLFVTQATIAQANWWDAKWFYRLPLSVQPLKGTPQEAQAAITINFTAAMKAANLRASLNPNSLHVIEVNDAGQVIDDKVSFQFTPERDFHPSKKAQGTLSLKLKGTTAQPRNFQLYFDTNNADDSLVPQPLRNINYVRNSRYADERDLYVQLSGIEPRIVTAPSSAQKAEHSERNLDTKYLPSVPNYLGKPEHKFFAGYCTWYAARKWKEFTGSPVTWHGDGGRWFDNAAAEGRKVATDPQAAVPGAVIVWTRAGHAGHVAFVEEVTEEGIRISEMNARGLWVVSDAFLPFSNLDKGSKYKFKGYVLPE